MFKLKVKKIEGRRVVVEIDESVDTYDLLQCVSGFYNGQYHTIEFELELPSEVINETLG